MTNEELLVQLNAALVDVRAAVANANAAANTANAAANQASSGAAAGVAGARTQSNVEGNQVSTNVDRYCFGFGKSGYVGMPITSSLY